MKLFISSIVLIVLSSLGLSAFGSDMPREQAYEIQIYDEISLEYIRLADAKKETYLKLKVLPNGNIVCPLVGEMKAVNLTTDEFKTKLNEALKPLAYSADLQIFHERGRVAVIGAVRNPGSYQISGRTSVYDVIGFAGGFSATANKRKVKVIKQNKDGRRQSFNINFPKQVFNAYESGIGEEKYILKEDDLVFVPNSKLKLAFRGAWHLVQVATIGLVTISVSTLMSN